MKRRLYFLLPDVASAVRTADDLLLARIGNRQMHFLAKRGTPLGPLHEASYLQKTDAVHGAQVGFALGALGGLILGIYMYATPPESMPLEPVVVLISTLIGAGFGAWASSMVAMAVPNSRLRAFHDAIEQGMVLLMVDVPLSRVDEVRELIARRHPEALPRGMEPTMPAFP